MKKKIGYETRKKIAEKAGYADILTSVFTVQYLVDRA